MISDYYPILFLVAVLLVFERQQMVFLLFLLVSVTAFGVDGFPVAIVPWLLASPVRVVFRWLRPDVRVS